MAFSNEYTLKVDIKRRMSNVVPTFKQGDTAILKFLIFDNGKAYDLTSFTSAEITFRTPSGDVVIGNPVLEDGLIVYELTSVEMSRVGNVTVILTINSGDTDVSIQPFRIFIYDSMKTENLSYVGILQDLIAETQQVELNALSVISDMNDTKDALEQDIVDYKTEIDDFNSKRKHLGNWNASTQYVPNNEVEFNGSTWRALRNNKGIAPVEGLDWTLIARKGNDGTGTVNRVREVFIATEGQKDFTLQQTYDQFQNRIDVTVMGVPQFSPDNFIELTNNSIRLSEGVPAGTEVIVVYYTQSIPMASDIQTTVDNHTTTLNNHESRVTNTEANVTSLTEQLAEKAKQLMGVPLAQMANVTIQENYTGVLPITYKDGWLWGIEANNKFVKSNNDGESWIFVANTPFGSVHSILWTNDGEVLITNGSGISKSSGWSNNPATATWTTKVTKSDPNGVGIFPYGIDGDGQKFIVNEYSSANNRAESRYVWISTDMGETFNVVLDTHIIDPDHTSHMHGVCYDKWADRFFVSHGHGILMDIFYSDDDGSNWTRLGGDFKPNASAMTMTATDNGIVCGSDSGDAGLYGIPRTEKPEDMRLIKIARWNVPREGVTGFAYRSFRDEETGQVFVAFRTDYEDINAVIMAGTATTGSTIWTSPTKEVVDFLYMAVTDKKVVGVTRKNGTFKHIKGDKPTNGVDSFDKGNINTGTSKASTSIAIGRDVVVNTAEEIIIGNNATLEPTSNKIGNVVIGSKARGASYSTVIGNNAQVLNNTSNNIALGANSKVSAINGIAIGNGANVFAGATGAIAIGQGTEAAIGAVIIGIGAKTGSGTVNATAVGSSAYAGNSGVAVGRLASAGSSQVAIGLSAIANHSNSIALGANVTTTAVDQLNIGGRHLEMKKVAEPTAVPADTGRLFVMDDGTGKLQLCVRLGATTIVLAKQP